MDSQDNPQRKRRGRPTAFNKKTDQNTIKSLDRALLVFETVAKTNGVTLSALAKTLGESPATLYRILTTLALHDMVEADPNTQNWHIGSGAFVIGSTFLRRTSLVETSQPILRKLMEETGETANLGIIKDNKVLFLSQAETQAPIRAFFAPGSVSAPHASGIGKVLLAHVSHETVAKIAAAGLENFTEHTKSNLIELADDLNKIRSQGFSVDDQEHNLGMRCIAAPVYNAVGEVIAGISISGPTIRVESNDIRRISKQVMRAANAISQGLGAPKSQ